MRTLSTLLLSLLVVPALACGGKSGTKAAETAEMPPTADCGKTIEALVPVMETPAIALVGDSPAQVPTLVGDLACQVAASGKTVVVAIEPEAEASATDLVARVEVMRAAGLEVAVAKEEVGKAVQRLSTEQPDARVIALAATAADIQGVPVYAINVVGDATAVAAPPALRANPSREGGFDAVLDLGVAAAAPEAPAPEAPAAEAPAAEVPAAGSAAAPQAGATN